MPPSVMKSLKEAGVTIRAGKSIVAMEPRLRGLRPRGWTSGTWENCGGLYDSSRKRILLGEFVQDESGEWVRVDSSQFTFRHELGHAWDFNALQTGAISQKSELLTAFKKELQSVSSLPESQKHYLNYFNQVDEGASAQEFVAQAFAVITGTSGSDPDLKVTNDLLASTFPESFAILRRLLR